MEGRRDEFQKRMLAESLSEQFGLALVAGDARAAEEVAREALELSLSEAMLYDLVVGPAMHRIGRLWAAGEIGVGHEHLATQIATRLLVLAHEAAGVAADRASGGRCSPPSRASSTSSRSTWARSCSSRPATRC